MSDTQHQETIERGKDDRKFDRAEERAPDKPTDLPKSGWKGVLKRTISEFSKDGGSDLAAALTYFAIMSIAPMLLALSTLLSIFGQDGGEGEGDCGQPEGPGAGDGGLEDGTVPPVHAVEVADGDDRAAGVDLLDAVPHVHAASLPLVSRPRSRPRPTLPLVSR